MTSPPANQAPFPKGTAKYCTYVCSKCKVRRQGWTTAGKPSRWPKADLCHWCSRGDSTTGTRRR